MEISDTLDYNKYREISKQLAEGMLPNISKTRAEKVNEAQKLLEEGEALKRAGDLEGAEEKLKLGEGLKKEIDQLNMTEAALIRSTSALEAFKEACNVPEMGDDFRDMKSALDVLQDGLDSGRVGTNKFRAALEAMFGPEALTWDRANTIAGKLG